MTRRYHRLPYVHGQSVRKRREIVTVGNYTLSWCIRLPVARFRRGAGQRRASVRDECEDLNEARIVRNGRSVATRTQGRKSTLGEMAGGTVAMRAAKVFLVVALVTSIPGCGSRQRGGDENGSSGSQLPKKETAIELEGCKTDTAEAEKLDANGDGKPEIVRVLKMGREVCRTVDLNFDGRVDRTTYFADNGSIRRIESDFDRDGVVDEIAIFEGGQPKETQSATTLDGKIDTWDYFKLGEITRTERDRNGDGIVDQWWEYKKKGCPIIHIDRDGDGRPDPGASIDYCVATGELVNAAPLVGGARAEISAPPQGDPTETKDPEPVLEESKPTEAKVESVADSESEQSGKK